MKGLLPIIVLGLCSCSPPVERGPALAPGEVVIHRDEWGVPHIYADREEDGFYGLGYATASDQVERWSRYVLFARGTTARAFGAEPNPELGDAPPFLDYQSRLWRHHEVAREAVDRLDPQLRSNYERFAEGFRHYMDEHPERVPEWAPRDLSVADLIAVPRAALWSSYQAGVGLQDCRRGGVTIPTTPPATSGPGRASNVWAVMPGRTATGGAILLTDPHGGIDGRFTYEYRLHAGELRSTGFALGPMMLVARNAQVGWGMTTGSPDVADCYTVETNTDDPQRYLFDGQMLEMETAEITIEVKDADPIVITAEYTRHNGYLSPVIARDGTKAYVVSTPYMDDAAPFANAIYRMNLASTVDELTEAMADNGVFPQNVLAADTHGDIVFVHAGETPVRPEGDIDWLQPVDGNTSTTAWQGIHPLEDLLIIRSPDTGFLHNNNVDPRFMAEPSPAEVEGKPDYILHSGINAIGRPNPRTIRAQELLSANEAMTREDAFAVTLDAKLPGTEAWIDVLSTAVGLVPPAEEDALFVDDLLAFDGVLDARSTGAIKYIYWREALREQLNAEEFEALLDPLWNEGVLTEPLAKGLIAAVGIAHAALLEVHGDLSATYGTEFRIGGDDDRSFPHSGGWTGGGPECSMGDLMCSVALLAFGHSPPNENNERLALWGSRIRRLDFYGPDGIDSFSSQNPGVSDDPESGHTDDQAEKLMSTGEMKPIRFEWSDLEAHIFESLTLTVPGSERQ